MNRVLAIVVTHNGMQWIDRCLQSLRESSLRCDAFVVDNASTDGTPEHVASAFPEVELIESKENTGFGAANNIGMRHALEKGYDYVYLLNQDAWILPDTLDILVSTHSLQGSFGILSPMQMTAGLSAPDRQFGSRVIPSSPSFKADMESGRLQPFYVVPRVMAAHWLITRECLMETGLFAPVFPHYGEDDNYCDRARHHGFEVVVVPSAKAVHDREFRVEPKEKVIYRNFRMTSLVRLCDINRSLIGALLYVPVFALVKSLKYRSMLPWKHLKELVGLSWEIRRTRAETLGKAAFLNDKR
jgi:GT2 family glycosyltransferase